MGSSSFLTTVRSFFVTCYQKVKNWIVETTPISDSLVRSYLYLRSGIGIIGVALPPVLVIGTVILNRRFDLSDSLSVYYYSVTGNVFVGSLWAIAIFLICYQYDYLDNIVSNIAGFCAIFVSLFPTTPDGVVPTQQQEIIGMVHFGFATGFLIALATMALLFTRENPGKDKVPDSKRKWLYRICGIAMFACIGLAALILLVPNMSGKWQHQIHPILIIETLAAWAFGIAWFVKGETLHTLKAAIQRLTPSRQAESDHSATSSQSTGEQPNGLPAASSQPVVE